MKRLAFLSVLIMTAAMMMWIVGCSEDSGTNDDLTDGDPNDLDYQFVESEVFSDGFLGGVDISMELATMLIDSIPGSTMAPNLSSSGGEDMETIVFDAYQYSYANGWHVFTIEGWLHSDDIGDTIDFDGIDSVQVLNNGVPVQVPDSNSNEIRYRAHLDMDARSGIMTRQADHSLTMANVGMSGDTISLNGSLVEQVDMSVEDTSGTCDMSLGTSVTVSNVQMDMTSDGCPNTGSLTAAVSVNLTCQGDGMQLSVDGTWTATGTFNGETTTTVISDGENQWTEVDSCGSEGDSFSGSVRSWF